MVKGLEEVDQRCRQLRGGSNWRTGADEARQTASRIEAERFKRGPDRRAVDDKNRWELNSFWS
jgi:hypothetical protein